MTGFTLAAVPFVMKIVMGIWVFISLALILIVLIQKGKGGGLSAAFGGIGNSLLGTKTGDFLTWVTISLVAVWLLLSVAAAKWFKPQASEYLQGGQMPQAPVSAPAETQQPTENQSGAETQKTDTPAPPK
ncbi:MAG: preprotein translocase subunit SecG [Sedimentisphaerales bacterium]